MMDKRNSLHHICCGLRRHLQWSGQLSVDFFAHSDIARHLWTEKLQSKGAGSQKKTGRIFLLKMKKSCYGLKGCSVMPALRVLLTQWCFIMGYILHSAVAKNNDNSFQTLARFSSLRRLVRSHT